MSKRWIVNPGPGFVDKCVSSGRFLAEDYRMAIRNSSIPNNFESNLEPSGRRFVIIGAKSVPMATAKSVFLALTLAGAESIAIKAPTEDEAWLIQNVLENWTPPGVEAKMFSMGSERLRDLPEWNKYIDQATDLVVFGGDDTAEAFSEFESKNRNVYIHGHKFSFGIVRSSDLTLTRLSDICLDFASYYGEGCLSPKFYFLIDDKEHDWSREASLIMQAEYGKRVEEFRKKLPMARKSRLVQELVTSNLVYKYVREEPLEEKRVFTDLYGDIRFVKIKKLSEIEFFLNKWQSKISTVACLYEDEAVINLLDSYDILRTCNFGAMQFPQFDEQFDHVDDFDIYCQ